jgi:hypothetical protein
MRSPPNWPKSANVLLHWKSAPHCVARGAKRGKKATPAHRGLKEKEATPVARASLVLTAREAWQVLKVCKGLLGQKVKKAIPAHRARQDARAREATLVARACPVLKVPRDLQGQKAIPVDPTRLPQLEDHISDRKSTWLRQGNELPYRPKDRMSRI